MIAGCYDPSWHADGYCDDVNNNEACFFDGGDCCGSNVNTEYCTECQCLEVGDGGSGGTTTPSGTYEAEIAADSIIWELCARKSAECLNLRNSFITISIVQVLLSNAK